MGTAIGSHIRFGGEIMKITLPAPERCSHCPRLAISVLEDPSGRRQFLCRTCTEAVLDVPGISETTRDFLRTTLAENGLS